jgi:phosphatidylglycerol:prolipoprotein diacylglycerol transferase
LPVHPTFLYESIWDLAVFFSLIFYRKRKKLDGEVFFLYMILYGAGRFWIEGLRTDSLMLGNLRISQVLAAIFVVLLSIIFYLRRKKAAKIIVDVDEESSSSTYGEILKQLKEEERIREEIKDQSAHV